ncbi:MAG: hypothetical protein ACO3IN_10375 [Steroidobacteraceae bacterium]
MPRDVLGDGDRRGLVQVLPACRPDKLLGVRHVLLDLALDAAVLVGMPDLLLRPAPRVDVLDAERIRGPLLLQHARIGLSGKRLVIGIKEPLGDDPDRA